MNSGVEIRFDTLAKDIIIKNDQISGVNLTDSKSKTNEDIVLGDKIIMATGRKGADWLKICALNMK